MLILVVYFGFVIHLYVVIDMLWPKLKRIFFEIKTTEISKKMGKKNIITNSNVSFIKIRLVEYIFRTILVIIASLFFLQK